jgi:hypothetical protein
MTSWWQPMSPPETSSSPSGVGIATNEHTDALWWVSWNTGAPVLTQKTLIIPVLVPTAIWELFEIRVRQIAVEDSRAWVEAKSLSEEQGERTIFVVGLFWNVVWLLAFLRVAVLNCGLPSSKLAMDTAFLILVLYFIWSIEFLFPSRLKAYPKF